MSNLFIRTTPKHINSIDPHACYEGNSEIRDRLLRSLDNDYVYTLTLLKDGKPIAIVTMFEMYSKVIEASVYLDKAVDKFKTFYAKAIRLLIELEYHSLELNRIQIMVATKEPWAKRWGSFLGMKLDGVLDNYGDENVSHYLFSKTRGA